MATALTSPLPILPNVAPPLRIDPRAYERGLGCVHCGLCLPACPTYTENGLEADSPRGRIILMLGLAEGKIEPTEPVRHHLDLCLDCRACETACPSGVVYHELIEETRSRLAASAPLSASDRLMRWVFFNIFTHPTRLKLALLPARLAQKIGLYGLIRKSGIFKLLPAGWQKMEQMLPATGPLWPRKLVVQPFQPAVSSVERPAGREAGWKACTTNKSTKIIGFFPGCVGSVMFEKVNRKAVELLVAAGAQIVVPPTQACCGAIHHHSGSQAPAEVFARRNIDAFLPKDGPPADFIATNIAGCGAMLREYNMLLRDDPAYAARAKDFASRVRDITEVLADLGLPEMKYAIDKTVTYHDACHLAHAQKVTAPPRNLLARIRGLKLVALPESDMCCGAAGTYNLTQPEMSSALAARKVRNIEATGAQICATGNVGCAMQIQSEADAHGLTLQVIHPVELLHAAAFGRSE